MRIVTTVNEMRERSRAAKREGKSIGFVPTMGYLHEGHLSLARAAKDECGLAVMSIFVNPTQFGPGEDIDRYPRDMERDRRLAEGAGIDILFTPAVGEMYPDGFGTFVEVEGSLADRLCGAKRPGHFRGVATVVAKLFNEVTPDKSYFGQKDAQQAMLIRRMAKDLDMPVEIRLMPIVRESDGLAMSSRNIYLSGHERTQALALGRSLRRAEDVIKSGEISAESVRDGILEMLEEGGGVKVDYVEIVDTENLRPVETVRDNTLIAVAAFVGGTRLIDNVIIEKVT
jgi:pantoate--beta-alanine ligase